MRYVFILLSLPLTVLFFFSIAMAAPQVTISAGAGSMSGSMNVAAAKGFFKDEGIDAKVIPYKGGRKALKKFLAGETDFGTCNLVGIITTDFDISQYRLIGSLSYTSKQPKLLARKSAGITKGSDLRGKKLAVGFKGNSHFFLYKFIVLYGIPLDEVEIVHLSKKDMPGAIASGQVDAICRNGKPIEKAKKLLGDDWVQFEDDSIHRKSVHLIASRKTLEKQGDLVKGLLKGTLRGESFIKRNIDEAIKLITKDKTYSSEAMDRAVRKTEFDLSLKQSLLLQMESIEQWAIDNKLVKRTTPRNYLKFIDYKPLESVAPEKVTLIR